MAALELRALAGIPEIRPGDDLASILQAALRHNEIELQAGDVLVVAQKIVSKAENRFLDLRTLNPSVRATELANAIGKEASFVEAVLRESSEVVRTAPNTLITRHRAGYVMANAGRTAMPRPLACAPSFRRLHPVSSSATASVVRGARVWST